MLGGTPLDPPLDAVKVVDDKDDDDDEAPLLLGGERGGNPPLMAAWAALAFSNSRKDRGIGVIGTKGKVEVTAEVVVEDEVVDEVEVVVKSEERKDTGIEDEVGGDEVEVVGTATGGTMAVGG